MDETKAAVDAMLHREAKGVTRLARLINAPVTTVHKWKKAGVPEWRWPQIEQALRTHDDFKDLNHARGR